MNDDAHASIPFSFPGVRGVRCLFATAHAGDMSLANEHEKTRALHNRARFKHQAGFALWAETYQVHQDSLVPATGSRETLEDNGVQADGLYTFAKSEALVLKTADCQPVFITKTDATAVAALHVGWRGNAMNFPGSAVQRLCRIFACDPADLQAVRGPSLGPAAAEFVNFHDEWPPEFEPWYNPGQKTMDLWSLTRHQLLHAGLRPDRIFGLDLCTLTMSGSFFSYRRKDAGRQISAIWME